MKLKPMGLLVPRMHAFLGPDGPPPTQFSKTPLPRGFNPPHSRNRFTIIESTRTGLHEIILLQDPHEGCICISNFEERDGKVKKGKSTNYIACGLASRYIRIFPTEQIYAHRTPEICAKYWYHYCKHRYPTDGP